MPYRDLEGCVYMPRKKHTISVRANNRKVWEFVRNMDNWAPLVPGYIRHEILNSTISTWEFKVDMGLIKKKIELEVTFLKWEEPTKVTFSLKGLNSHFEGEGYFIVEGLDHSTSRMIGFLDIHSTGTFPSLTDQLLEPKLEELIEELTIAVCHNIVSET